jgi:hypothetical protein
MKYFLCLLALMVALPAATQTRPEPEPYLPDSGIYYDDARDGEGIVVIRDNEGIVFYFYTYHPDQGCWNSKDEDCSDQRFFVSSKESPLKEMFVVGELYTTLGVNYPDCAEAVIDVSPPAKPEDKLTCGRNILVGEFLLSREDFGWTLEVDQVGDFLAKDDPLYTTVYTFDVPLMFGTE